ncbi:hypothetical protein KTE91_33140 [Burkholderia multivorans]|uniref:DUF7446 family protein n=1 Tax=Burkholderia multivorans TaxID=87883 RepID=UPI001C23DAD8|nr:hypothetical protein [Burkholderia multivorans]MBU9439922.1 hypothetical protein [Burkholderia multivorans]
MTIRVACTSLLKRIKAGHLNNDDRSFRDGGVDVTADVLKAIVEFVEPGNVVSVNVDGKPKYEIEVREIAVSGAHHDQ